MASLMRWTGMPLTETLHRPLSLFGRPSSWLENIDRIVSDMWESWEPVRMLGDMMPRVDMWEEKEELVLRAELPGMMEEDIDVSLEGDLLTIKAEKVQEEASEEKTYYTCERSYGRFSRIIRLPFLVQIDKVSASFDKGVLDIRLPKAEEAKAKHVKIEVK